MKRPQYKRLSINHIARASIRVNAKAYRSLAIGIFLSIFLITVICLCAQGFLLIQQEKLEQKMGRQDGFFMDSTLTDAQVHDCGMIERIGHVYVTASIADIEEYLGYYDSDAEWMLNRTLKEGRLPQQPGEIAVEQSVLEALRSEVGVGQQITLDITPVDGVKENGTFLIVGILGEQSDYLKPWAIRGAWNQENIYSFPSILLSPKESAFRTGRTAVHQLVTVKNGYTAKDALNYWAYDRRDYPFFIILADGRVSCYDLSVAISTSETYMLMIMVGMVGLALLAACGIGIAQAMEGQLSRKVEQIGMLRAVGGTRRQIRKIFGREAWVLALLLSPLSVAGGCLFVLMLEWIFPDVIRFKASLGLLLPIILFSVICIFICAYFPLMKASRIMPMQAMRDTTMLRRIKSIRSKMNFSVPKLISSRQFRIHPTRQLGAAILVAVMLYCSGMGVYVLHAVVSPSDGSGEAFSIYNDSHSWTQEFIDITAPRTLTEQDMAQIRAIPQVQSMVVEAPVKVSVLLDEVTQYHKDMAKHVYYWNNTHVYEENNRAFKVLKKMFSLEQIPFDMLINVVVIDSEKALEPYVADGDVDISALNAGREVLVYAPSVYVIDDYYSVSIQQMVEGETYIEDSSHIIIQNDYFTAEQTLPLFQISKVAKDEDFDAYNGDEYYEKMYTDAKRQDAVVTLGAVLDSVPKQWGLSNTEPCIITTEQGIRALGMKTGSWQRINIYLKGEVDLETEAQIEERINTITMRGENIRMWNQIAINRENREASIQMAMALCSVVVTFFAVSVSMISGAVKRRIRSDMRMIGTLRAVGANKRVIEKCYLGHISVSIIAGLILSVPLYFKSLESVYTKPSGWLIVLIMLFFAAICYGCCRLAMKKTLQEVMKKSVVENIKEL